MNTLKGVLPVLLLLAAWAAGIGTASAQANSIEAFDVSQQAGSIVIRVTTREPLQGVPANFTVANPARIAFDFPKTVNALGRSAQDIGQGELRSMNLITAADKSRLVLNLRRPVVHEARVDGRNLLPALDLSGIYTPSFRHFQNLGHFALSFCGGPWEGSRTLPPWGSSELAVLLEVENFFHQLGRLLGIRPDAVLHLAMVGSGDVHAGVGTKRNDQR